MHIEPKATPSPRRNRAIRLFVSSLLLLAFTALPARAEKCDTCGFGSSSLWTATYETAYGWDGKVYGIKVTTHYKKSYPDTSKLWVESAWLEIWGASARPLVTRLALKKGNTVIWEEKGLFYIPNGDDRYRSWWLPIRHEVTPGNDLLMYLDWAHECNEDSCPDPSKPGADHGSAFPIRTQAFEDPSVGYPDYGSCYTPHGTKYPCRWKRQAAIDSSGGGNGPNRPETPEIPGGTEVNVN